VKFHIRHAVDVSPAQAIAAYGSPAFYEGRLPRDDIEVLGVVRHEDTGERVLMEVRFKFTGNLGAPVRAFVDPARMSWVTRTELWPAALRSEWVVLPDHYPDRLTASGTYRFEAGEAGPDSTVVVVEGELKVHAPIVGRTAERVIVSDLGAYLEDEVASITARNA
jgi:Protein of unknown function (DUF2505)